MEFSNKINKLAEKVDITINEDYFYHHSEEIKNIKECMVPLFVYRKYDMTRPCEYQRAYSASYYRDWYGDYEDPVTLIKLWLNFIEVMPEHKDLITITCKETNEVIDYFSI